MADQPTMQSKRRRQRAMAVMPTSRKLLLLSTLVLALAQHLPPTTAEECGNCFGAGEPGQCCNTCDDIIRAYKKKKWGYKESDFGPCRDRDAKFAQEHDRLEREKKAKSNSNNKKKPAAVQNNNNNQKKAKDDAAAQKKREEEIAAKLQRGVEAKKKREEAEAQKKKNADAEAEAARQREIAERVKKGAEEAAAAKKKREEEQKRQKEERTEGRRRRQGCRGAEGAEARTTT